MAQHLVKLFTLAFLFFGLFSNGLVRLLDEVAEDDNRVTERSAFCDENRIYFTLLFERPFAGVIYTFGEYPNQKCTYADGRRSSASRYNLTIPLNDCSSVRFANGSRQNTVIVQRDPNILQSYDRLYIITCTTQNSQQSDKSANYYYAGGYGVNKRVTLSFSGITVENALNTTEFVTESPNTAELPTSATNIDYSVEVQVGQGPNARLVDRPLIIGEPISYVVKLKNLGKSNDAKIGRCWATDGESEIQLSDDEGCTIQTSNNIWNNFRTVIGPNDNNNNDSSRILINEIKTWAFPTSNRVNIYCNLHICSPLCSSGPCTSKHPKSSASEKNKILRAKRTIGNEPNNGTSADQFSDPFLEKTVRLKFGYSVKTTNSSNSEYSSNAANFPSLLSYNLTAEPFNQTSLLNDGGDKSTKLCLTKTNLTTAFIMLTFCLSLAVTTAAALLFFICRCGRKPEPRRYVVRNDSTLTLNSACRGLAEAPKF